MPFQNEAALAARSPSLFELPANVLPKNPPNLKLHIKIAFLARHLSRDEKKRHKGLKLESRTGMQVKSYYIKMNYPENLFCNKSTTQYPVIIIKHYHLSWGNIPYFLIKDNPDLIFCLKKDCSCC
jgi:hypothetical protein